MVEKYRSTVIIGCVITVNRYDEGREMAYQNLKAEIARSNLSLLSIANGIGVSYSTFWSWANAKTPFPITKAKEVRDKFFEGQSLDYLFEETPDEPQ